jgi:hypothetical protein
MLNASMICEKPRNNARNPSRNKIRKVRAGTAPLKRPDRLTIDAVVRAEFTDSAFPVRLGSSGFGGRREPGR